MRAIENTTNNKKCEKVDMDFLNGRTQYRNDKMQQNIFLLFI